MGTCLSQTTSNACIHFAQPVLNSVDEIHINVPIAMNYKRQVFQFPQLTTKKDFTYIPFISLLEGHLGLLGFCFVNPQPFPPPGPSVDSDYRFHIAVGESLMVREVTPSIVCLGNYSTSCWLPRRLNHTMRLLQNHKKNLLLNDSKSIDTDLIIYLSSCI